MTDAHQCSAGGTGEMSTREKIARKLASFDGNKFEGKYGIIIAEHNKEIYRKRADEILALASPLERAAGDKP